MRAVLTPAEMGEADRRAIVAGAPIEVLMERAGRAVAREVRRVLGGTYGRRVVVLCGEGNNGGDGLVAARVLRAWGARVDVFELAHGVEGLPRALTRADAVIDAMFGTGLRRPLTGNAASAAEAVAGSSVLVVAVDIPSGVDGGTGAVTGSAIEADRTVTFAAEKPGLLFEPGRSLAGVVTVADIGIDVGTPALGVTEERDVRAWLPRRSPDAHKWSVGGLMVVGGHTGMTGAPMLASHAAMRAGAGIVWCSLAGAAAAASAPGSEVITKALPVTPDGALDVGAAAVVLADLARFRALVLGPGLGRAESTARVVVDIATEAPVPLVLDADGCNALAGEVELLRGRPGPTVLTPHDGEYARLVGAPPGVDRIAAARTLAGVAHAVVLLKGPTTVVAEPDGGRVACNPTGGPWLATAGTGDVLSGLVGAFLARSVGAFEAAAAAAWVHGRAADVAGHTGLVAGDLVAAIPTVLREPREQLED
ncbi:MAG: NAD(P)H-hydrate dehydratase [Actinobacteria bacterium]|nr:NAD(P)H-hydrate dehydratase [Actinomycetota bacterium]